jgi:fructose-1,6-bisphosphatase/inositol monophosphatase family enzyme
MIRNQVELLEQIRAIHAAIRDDVVAACEQTAMEQLAAIVGDDAGDTIFAIDRVSEDVLLARFGELAREWSCVLVAEGLGETGMVTLPPGTDMERAELRVIVDPIDGTRGLMYQKRAAWILTGVAPNRGAQTSLRDIELAVQTEIPLVKQHLCDTLWAIKGQGAGGERLNRLTGEQQPLAPRPSRERTIAQGYGGLARFFPGAREELAAIDEAVIERTLGPVTPGRALAFEDQYISTGGQLYELMMGHDRWIADLRPLVEPVLRRRGLRLGMCCHPYDLCTELIGREAGIIVTDEAGRPPSAPLDVSTDLAWIGYANQAIHDQVMPVLRQILVERDLWKPEEAL